MIGKLRGLLDSIGVDHAIVDVGGVGYEVACSSKTLSQLPAPGEPVTLFIETHVREDAIRLYGFLSEAERGWFRLLQSVQGVGSKVALSILGTLDVASLANAIALQDKGPITRAPGVGPKVAVRLVTELKDKAPPMAISATSLSGSSIAKVNGSADSRKPTPAADAISALINLGYAPMQANAAISSALGKAGENAKTSEIIRLALKELAQ